MKIYNNPLRWSGIPLALLVLIQSLMVMPLGAQSSGPTQPEFQQTVMVGADNLVDPFTGNFNYSIPLMEVGGLPLTLSYSSDHKMEEEASWVGFGWTLNPGAVARQVRGLPDDFKGEEIVHRGHMVPSITTGITPGADFEFFGYFGLSATQSFTYNNYTGFDVRADFSPSINLSELVDPLPKPEKRTEDLSKEEYTKLIQENARNIWKNKRFNSSISANFSSRNGLESMAYGMQYKMFYANQAINFGGFTYTPASELPKRNIGLNFSTKIGGKIFLPDGSHATLTGYRMWQGLADNVSSQPAYGYMYLDGAVNNDQAIMDYNVEKGGIIDQSAPRLPLPYGTPDVFSVSGPGLSGQIEVARNDLGVFRPSGLKTYSVTAGLGGDVALGNIVRAGLNINAVRIKNTRGDWDKGSELVANRVFLPNARNQETVFMRMVGDPTAQVGKDWYEDIGKDAPLSVNVDKKTVVDRRIMTMNNWELGRSGVSPNIEHSTFPAANYYPRSRRPRARVVNYLTAEEAAAGGFERPIYRYGHFADADQNFTVLNELSSLTRVSPANGKQAHHISQIDVTEVDGRRCVFGLPVYNFLKREVTFNASGLEDTGTRNEGGSNYGTISYEDAMDAPTVGNRRGIDQFFDEVVTSAYPTAHLLTGVLSPEYLDRTGDGPTVDDQGNYVKIGYAPAQVREDGVNTRIGWRTPVQPFRAIYQRGNLADPDDDKASFTYGEKEIYYVHHMDSKTHRAVFITSERSDAKPVDGHGIIQGDTHLRRLDEIKLYTLAELNAHGDDASPLKTVHFKYKEDGSAEQISGDLPNADAGKLTLHSVSFTYADNERGKENPYVFNYKTEIAGQKVNYQPFLFDGWGTQRAEVAGENNEPLNYPYADQNADRANAFCDVGNLEKIDLPSGAEIIIDYEADDYAYVQDKRAGKMFDLLGFSEEFDPEDSDPDISDQLYTPNIDRGFSRLFTYIDVGTIPRDADGNLPDEMELRRLYLEDVKQLYFSAIVSLRGAPESNERVSGYATFDPDFIAALPGDVAGQDRLVLRFQGLSQRNNPTTNRNSIHPISFAALEKMRLELPRLVYEESPRDGDIDPEDLLVILYQSLNTFRNFYLNRLSFAIQDARKFEKDGSYVRLADPNFGKFGDGSRVRTVTLNDNWLSEFSEGSQATDYVQRYTYTTTDPISDKVISSGVAANEPINGKEGMLFVNVEKKNVAKFLAPNPTYYTEAPVGLTFYPGPRVGYSKVGMRIELEETFKQSKPGNSVYEFHTARDFPVRSYYSEIDNARVRSFPQVLPFSSRSRNKLAVSQGFVIEINDMHGKPKATQEYGFYGDLISSTKYRYRQPDNASGSRLDNEVEVVKYSQGTDGITTAIEQDLMGMDVDLWIESTGETTISEGGGVQVNTEVSAVPPIPVPVAAWIPIPSHTRSVSELRTVTSTKLITRSGILEEVEVTNNGSSLSTINHRWDALTGSPVLTSTENEYDQPIYSQSLPAYWMTPQAGMGPAYENLGDIVKNATIMSGRLTQSGFDHEEAFEPGDEILCFLPGVPEAQNEARRLFIVPFEEDMYLINNDGTLASTQTGGYTLKVIRSGKRNILAANSAQTASLTRPNASDNIYWTSGVTDNSLLSSSAVEYSDAWGDSCTPLVFEEPECENKVALMDRINSVSADWVITDDLNDNVDCTIQGPDWTADVNDLIACGLCYELFKKYARNYLIEDLGDYGTCDDGVFTVDPAKESAIMNCEFFAGNRMLTGGIILLESETGIGTCSSTNADCDLGTPLTIVPANFEDDGPNNDAACFPWRPASGINPYLDGRRGNWRVAANYVSKQTPRKQSFAGEVRTDGRQNEYGQPLLYQDGTFDGYRPYWFNGDVLNPDETHQLVTRIEHYDDHGHPLETTNAIGIPSATQYGFSQSLPVAVAQNALRTDIGFESFEDYRYNRGSTGQEFWRRHFGLAGTVVDPGNVEPRITLEAAHTGLYSFKAKSGGELLINTFPVYDITTDGLQCPDGDDCNEPTDFAPMPGKRYLYSAWVASEGSLKSGLNPARAFELNQTPSFDNSVYLDLRFLVDGVFDLEDRVTAFPAGPIVEGWQQVNQEFTVPENATDVVIALSAPQRRNTNAFFFFDDIRVQPYESAMTTYVYHPESLLLMAQLDDRGYALLYEYDDERRLIRRKRETERGVMTIEEQHQNLKPTLSED